MFWRHPKYLELCRRVKAFERATLTPLTTVEGTDETLFSNDLDNRPFSICTAVVSAFVQLVGVFLVADTQLYKRL